MNSHHCLWNKILQTPSVKLILMNTEESDTMKDNVLISVSGSHIYENYTEDLMEMLTPGNYYVKGWHIHDLLQ